MLHGHEFFSEAVAACKRLRQRGVLLTRHPEQLPDRLPDEVLHVEFVPLSWLAPRSAAIVHHAGIGTLAQGLAAGIPHLAMPMSHDQPDNAARLRRLGVGLTLPPKQFRTPRIAAALDELLGSSEVLARCRGLADRFDAGRPWSGLAKRSRTSASRELRPHWRSDLLGPLRDRVQAGPDRKAPQHRGRIDVPRAGLLHRDEQVVLKFSWLDAEAAQRRQIAAGGGCRLGIGGPQKAAGGDRGAEAPGSAASPSAENARSIAAEMSCCGSAAGCSAAELRASLTKASSRPNASSSPRRYQPMS